MTVTVEAGSGFRSVRLAANAAGSCTAHVDAALPVSLLAVSLLAAATPAPGVTVHAIAVEA
ncbi:hypothetical protein [Streptomyces sp. NPDC086776]|uniref:hypothetical protein n=1 Tax=Streptomyces sp. NPDC086776 TaxID=3365756 RepID=UPI00380F967B